MQRENYGSESNVDESIRERHRSVADDILSEEEYGILIGGEWVESNSGETFESVDSTTGETLARFQHGTPEDVDRAVEAAWEAYDGDWGSVSPRERSKYLNRIADALEERGSEIARLDTLEMGKPNMHSLFVDIRIMVDQYRHFAALARSHDEGRMPKSSDDKLTYVKKEPHGVVGLISAWNFPAMFTAWKTAPALAAGNAVVYKPSSRAVLGPLEIVKEMDRILPDGAINIVTGRGSEVGDAITSHEGIRKISLTGSVGAGQYAMRNASENIVPVSLELGGKNPNIIFPDADLEDAVEGALISIFYNQGEQCTAGSRMFLHQEIYDEFLDLLIEETQRLTVGDPLGPNTDIGPLVDHEHLDRVKSYVETAKEEGAEVVYGGSEPDDESLEGAPFFEPTILSGVENEDTVACDEVFGPVLSVLEWSDYDEMIAKANDTEYGLASAVWTTDLETAHRTADDLEAGTVWVNTYNYLIEPSPHGGYKKSGIGRELSKEALDEYTQTKTVKLNFGKLPRM